MIVRQSARRRRRPRSATTVSPRRSPAEHVHRRSTRDDRPSGSVELIADARPGPDGSTRGRAWPLLVPRCRRSCSSRSSSSIPFDQLFLRGLYQQNAAGHEPRATSAGSSTRTCSTGDEFREGLWHSIQYVLSRCRLGLVLGTLLAVAAHRELRGIRIFQTIFSSTVATSVAVASVALLRPVQPADRRASRSTGCNDPDLALFGVSLSSIWQNLGLSFIIVLAGLQTVPDELMEAATLDGYGPMRRFFRVTLPLISPVLLFLVVVLVVFALQAFAQIELISRGGPAGSLRDARLQDLPAADARPARRGLGHGGRACSWSPSS